MSTPAFLRRRDRATVPQGETPSINLSPLCGAWINTETRTRWISRIEVREDGRALVIHPFGASHDWGETRAEQVYATSLTSHEGGGFVVNISVESMEAQLQAYVNQGLMIVATFSRVRSGAGRVAREYFRAVRP